LENDKNQRTSVRRSEKTKVFYFLSYLFWRKYPWFLER
jgi:hypothetical protein